MTITLIPTTLPAGTVGVTYNVTLTASGGTPPYNFSKIAGSLPPGLSLTTTGPDTVRISGAPSAAETDGFTIRAMDSAVVVGGADPIINALGVGLCEVSENSTDLPWVDVMANSSYRWTETDTFYNNTGGVIAVDVDDWPTALTASRYATILLLRCGGHYPTGDWLMSWTGTATFSSQFDGTFTSTGANTGKITVGTATNDGILLAVTSLNPADPPKNIKVCMPGFSPGSVTRYTWNPDFLAAFRDGFGNCLYGSLRFMDWLGTNSQEMFHWASAYDGAFQLWEQRTQVSRRSYSLDASGSFGHSAQIPLELCLDLCNVLQTRPWLNVPFRLAVADGAPAGTVRGHTMPSDVDAAASIVAFGQCIEDNLDADIVPMIETGNENWNPGFDQANYFYDILAISGFPTREAQLAYSARKTGDLVKTVCPRALTIFGAQQTAGISTDGMAYLGGRFGLTPAEHHIDIIAPALYWGELLGNTASVAEADAMIAAGAAAMEADLYDQATRPGGLIDGMQKETAVANRYGTLLFAYEGGLYNQCSLNPTYQPIVDFMADYGHSTANTAQYAYFLKDVWLNNGGQHFNHYQGPAGVWSKVNFGPLWEYIYAADNTNNYRLHATTLWKDTYPVHWEPTRTAATLLLPTTRYLTNDGFGPMVRTTQRTGTIYMVQVPSGNLDGLTESQRKTKIMAGQRADGSLAINSETIAATGSGVDLPFTEIAGQGPSNAFDVWFTQDNHTYVSTPIKTAVTTLGLGSGVVLKALNDNGFGGYISVYGTTYGTQTFLDQSAWPKQPHFTEYAPRYWNSVTLGATLGDAIAAPTGMTSYVYFDTTQSLNYFPNVDFGLGTGDFELFFAIYIPSGYTTANFKPIIDMRTAASDQRLYLETDGSRTINIKVGTSVVLTASVPLSFDAWDVWRLSRVSGSLSLYSGVPGGGALTLRGVTGFTTDLGTSARVKVGKDCINTGGLLACMASLLINKGTGASTSNPSLPL